MQYRRRRTVGFVGVLTVVGALGLGIGYQPWQHSESQPQASGDAAADPGSDEQALGAFSGTVEASATPAPSASTASNIDFTPAGTTEADVPVVINDVETPVNWLSTISDGTLYKTPRSSYPGKVDGTTVVTAYWNDISSIKLDQALTDQNGFKTYDIPSDTVNYGLDTSRLTNTVLTYPDATILKSLHKQFHGRAQAEDATRLQNVIHDNANVPDDKNDHDVSDINDYILRQNLSRGAILQSIIQQGQAGLEANLKAQAATEGITADQIDFVFIGDTPPKSIAYAPGPNHPSFRGDQFRYWNVIDWTKKITVQPFVNGGTS
jgi:hypothetical protein